MEPPRVPPDNGKQVLGEEVVSFVVRGKEDRIRTPRLDFKEPHTAFDAAGFGFITHGRCDPALLASDYRFSLQLRVARLLTSSEKRVTVDMDESARVSMQR
jgi:hypothetical protein